MKLVGTYMAIILGAKAGINHNNKPVLDLKFDVLEEMINGEWAPMPVSCTENKPFSLDPRPTKTGKSPAQYTVEMLRKACDFKGGMNDLEDLAFKRVQLVCPDEHPKYTTIKFINHPDSKPGAMSAGKQLKEFESDLTDEINKIFDSIQ